MGAPAPEKHRQNNGAEQQLRAGSSFIQMNVGVGVLDEPPENIPNCRFADGLSGTPAPTGVN